MLPDCIVPGRSPNAYATIFVGGKSFTKHRLAWRLRYGQIPPGMVVCHKCDTPGCINTDHLFLGTYADNSRDMVNKGRHAAGRRARAGIPNRRRRKHVVIPPAPEWFTSPARELVRLREK